MAKPEGKQGRLTRATLTRAVADGSIETVIVGFTDPYGRLMGKRYDARFFIEDTLAYMDATLEMFVEWLTRSAPARRRTP